MTRISMLAVLLVWMAGTGWCTEKPAAAGGDPRKIDFVLPWAKAVEQAKADERLIFLKPIYGGVDEDGARDYRCGSW